LLSSLPGAAAVGVKIEGVSHEFTALPHLQEDILEFILNLKKLRLKVYGDETVKLELEVHGAKEIKAADIKKNSAVEIANPDLVIGHITDMAGSLKAEIFVRSGMGYEMIESRENHENELGYIEMDSIFSPVMATGLKIENVRVGKMTNWDKLILDITTDGTVKPDEAFYEAVKILLDQYNALSGESVKEKAEKTEEETSLDSPEKTEPGAEETALAEPAVEEADEDKPKKKRGRPKKSE
jgi:DNA-directed RNA polymerase subunit alpha